ncbi:MAG: alpha/beta hydrolase [Gammaproteobacteria bacterium]|nr:alpha/beta hydrolase [Gammaproteobacteria bacterium]
MPVNPQTKQLIEKLSQAKTKPIHEISIEEARKIALDRSKTIGGKALPVAKVENITILGSGGEIPLRIYTPENIALPCSAALYFFSGGLTWGSVEGSDAICRALANSSKGVVVAVEYSLAPENKYPVAVNEAYEAAKWLFANSEELNFNPKQISVIGYSAGGNLAALTAINARNAGLSFAKQVLICPWLDLSGSAESYKKYAQGYLLETDAVKWFAQNYLPADADARDPRISPLWESNLEGLPKTLIISAEFDPLVDENAMYADKLKAANIDVTYSCYQGQIHQLLAYRGELEQEKNPIDEIGEFLQSTGI